MSRYSVERKRAAVEVFRAAKKLRTENGAKWLDPSSLASVAAGGASQARIYEWLKSDLSGEAQQPQEDGPGRPPVLSEDQVSLLVGFAISTRTSLQALALTDLARFCTSYLNTSPSLSTLSRIMTEHGFTSQKALSRNSRMVSPEVVEDALSAIEEIRSFGFPPHRIIAMDETGLWSNITSPRTYHFKNWFETSDSMESSEIEAGHVLSPASPFFHPLMTMVLPIPTTHLIIRGNAVVRETGDEFRDTVALTLRGDGVDIPPFTIVHTYKNASAASGRRCAASDTPIKGMNTERMIDYIDHIAQYVQEPSLLLLDRLSSHTAAAARRHIEARVTPDGQRLFTPIYLPPKTAFLISPLDMGAIAAFKAHYYRFDRSAIQLKLRAVHAAWDAVSNEALRNICLNCGIVGEESIDSLRQRFMGQVVGAVPAELEVYADFYDSWKSGTIEVEGASRGRGITLELPEQLPEGCLDGVYWTHFGRGLSQ
jgi:hypothetical protein